MHNSDQKRVPERDVTLLKEYIHLVNRDPPFTKEEMDKLMVNKQQFYQMISYVLARPYSDHVNELRAEVGLDPI